MTTADASSAVAVAARDPTSWTPEATPSTRVVYVTKDHRMFVAEVDDVLADTTKSSAANRRDGGRRARGQLAHRTLRRGRRAHG